MLKGPIRFKCIGKRRGRGGGGGGGKVFGELPVQQMLQFIDTKKAGWICRIRTEKKHPATHLSSLGPRYKAQFGCEKNFASCV